MDNMEKKVVIIGAGGHAKVIIDILKKNKEYNVIGCTDKKEGRILGVTILGDDSILPELFKEGISLAFVAIGNNMLRQKMAKKVRSIGFEVINVISSFSCISESANLGSGIAIMPGAIINADVTIHDDTVINTGSSIDHDCTIGKAVHVAPGCNLSGKVTVGDGTFLGTGTKVIDRISIGSWSILGSGAVVVRNFPDRCLGLGIPAIVKKKIAIEEGSHE